MQDELSTKMHSEFWITPETEKRHTDYAVFQLVSYNISLVKALDMMQLTIDDVRPYVAGWNGFSAKQIVLDDATLTD